MTKQEITAKIKEAEDTLKSLREQLEKPEGLWKPKEGDEYWFINNHAKVDRTIYRDGWGVDIANNKIGNYYPTEEAAKKELDKRIALQEMREYIASCDIGWKGKGMKAVPFVDKEGKTDCWYASEGEAVQPDNLYIELEYGTAFVIDQADNIRKYFGV